MKYLITFSYDGSKFYGYEKQINKRTVQGEIEEKLKIISNKKVSMVSSGRTDRGVHALNQKAHFNLDINISLDKLKTALNSLLDGDIYIKDITTVDDNFHARFDVLKKEYLYVINVGEYNPIAKDYIYQYCHKLDVLNIRKATKYFIGTLNYKSFTCGQDKRDNYVRTIFNIKVKEKKNTIYISFIGDGFMRYQVRNMIGFLLDVGSGKRESKEVKKVIRLEDRTTASLTAPACGLYLKQVYYKKNK